MPFMLSEDYWRRSARMLAWRVNLAWWLKFFNPWLLIVAAGGMAAILITRRNLWNEAYAWGGICLVLGFGAILACLLSKARWFSANDALVRLESAAGLNNRLSTAAAGVGSWPSPPKNGPVSGQLRWNVWETFLPSLAVIALLWSASWIPIPDVVRRPWSNVEKPTAAKQVEEWLEKLQQTQELDQRKIESLAQQFNELTEKSPEQWFEQSNLEAADSLRDQIKGAARSLQRDAKRMDEIMKSLRENDQIDPQIRQELADQFGAAMEGLQNGKLGLNQELMDQLKQLDPNMLGNFKPTPEQLQQLRDALKHGQQAAQNVAGVNQGKQGDGNQQEGPGQGGVSRGRGDAELTMKNVPTFLGTNKLEGMSNQDLSRAGLGDSIGESAAKPEADTSEFSTGATGGDASTVGQGGEAVWRDNLMPEERDALRAYFK